MKMAYENDVLYGHQHVRNVLLESQAQRRLHHAWLFSGPAGVGKATCTYQLIRYLFEDSVRDFNTAIKAPTHQNHLLKSLGHPDLLVVQAPEDTQSISIESVREIREFIHKTSAMAPYRAVIIDGVELMTLQASNALLKSLEEPPKNVLFFLIAHNKGGVLSTIRSRCFSLEFTTLPFDIFQDFFDDMAQAYYALSRGRVGWALAFEDLGGITLYDQLLSCLIGIKTRASDSLTFAPLFSREMQVTSPFMQELFQWWVQRLIRGIATEEVPTFISAVDQRAWHVFSADDNIENFLSISAKLPDVFREIAQLNLDPRPVLMNTLLSIAK